MRGDPLQSLIYSWGDDLCWWFITYISLCWWFISTLNTFPTLKLWNWHFDLDSARDRL
jgi:hypothetical protein